MTKELVPLQFIIPHFPSHVYVKKQKEQVLIKVGFNLLYATNMHFIERFDIMNMLKGYASLYIKPCKVVIPPPVMISISYFNIYNYGMVKKNRKGIIVKPEARGPESCDWDLDNLSVLWRKAITDVLKQRRIIPEDTANIAMCFHEEFIPCEFDQRKIIVTVSPHIPSYVQH